MSIVFDFKDINSRTKGDPLGEFIEPVKPEPRRIVRTYCIQCGDWGGRWTGSVNWVPCICSRAELMPTYPSSPFPPKGVRAP